MCLHVNVFMCVENVFGCVHVVLNIEEYLSFIVYRVWHSDRKGTGEDEE